MISTPIIFEHNFDDQTISDLEDLRNVRLGLAQKQLENVQKTATTLQVSGLHKNSGDEFFVAGLRFELESKIEMLKSRIDQKGVFYTDEVQFYLSIVEKSQPA